MLEKLLALSVRHRMAVLVCTLLLVVFGVRAFSLLPIDAVPDLTNVQTQVLTTAPALGPLDVERLVSAPVERVLAGLPRVKELRSLSLTGVSAVTVVFDDDVDPFFARQLVSERMSAARAAVSSEVGTPELGPMATGLGEIFQFEVRGTEHSLMQLRSILDWEVAPRLRLVPGVVEVNTFGGALKTYEVSLDPQRLNAVGLGLNDVFEALKSSHRIAGGGAIIRGPEALLVRGEGLIQSLEDLRNVVLKPDSHAPVLLGQVAELRFAPMLRQGAATRDARGEIVIGVAVMMVGENSRTVSQAVSRALVDINRALPRGVRIEPFYDRTELVQKTLKTVERSLAEGGALVVVVLFLMLRNLRAGLVGAVMIPLCMLGAFIGMRAAGVSGNLMSLGAIDFGLIVDGAIILLENAVHHLAEAHAHLGRPLTREERDGVTLKAALEVRSATAFGELVIALVYVPILALEGVEGRMFRPMALTVLFALGTAFVLSLTFVPALASALLPLAAKDLPSPVLELARKAYEPALKRVLARPRWAFVGTLVLGVWGVWVARGLGSEFTPQLDEGSLVIEVVRLPSTSLDESVRHGTILEKVLRTFPEVETVATRSGRPEIANDPMGVQQSDVFVMLKPRSSWTTGRDREALVEAMSLALRQALPGISFGFSQPIQMRTNELVSGVRADVAVRVYGADLALLAKLGRRIESVLASVPGASDVRADQVTGLPVLRVQVKREALARYGTSVDEVLRAVDVMGGVTLGEILEGSKRFPLRVRLADNLRNDLDAVRRIPLRLAGGALVPLEAVADLEQVDEPLVINREGAQRRLVIQCNVRGRDLGGFVAEAQRRVDAEVANEPGTYREWGGQFENLSRAKLRLMLVVPLVLALILGLLYTSFGDYRPAVLIFANVPFAALGGVFALALRAMPFSITASVGFIALFGVAVLNGLVLVSQIRSLIHDGLSPQDAAEQGARRRLRPVLTTALVASLGFIPMALATGEGAEVQRPLATVVIGGLVSSTLLTLLVLPALCARFGGSWLPRTPQEEEQLEA